MRRRGLRTFDRRHLPQGRRLGAAGRSYLSVGFSKKTYYYIEQRRAALWDILIGRRCSQTRLPPESRLSPVRCPKAGTTTPLAFTPNYLVVVRTPTLSRERRGGFREPSWDRRKDQKSTLNDDDMGFLNLFRRGKKSKDPAGAGILSTSSSSAQQGQGGEGHTLGGGGEDACTYIAASVGSSLRGGPFLEGKKEVEAT